MKKIVLFLSLILATSFNSNSQRFGNEWIVDNQQYFKIVVDTKGIYKITKEALDAVGFITNAKNPKNLQLFFRGKEIAINVVGETDNTIDNGDYIEFYAMNNDGKQDSELYRPKTRPHNYYSLYSDETTYFLTFGTSLGKRMAEAPVTNTNLVPEAYYMAKKLTVFAQEWNYDIAIGFTPTLIQSYYEPFEGMVGDKHRNAVPSSATYTSIIPLDGYSSSAGVPVKFESLVCSRNNIAKTLNYNLGGGVSGNFSLNNFEGFKISRDVSTITGTNLTYTVSFVSDASSDGRNPYSLAYELAAYPRNPVFLNNSEYGLKVNSTGTSRLQLTSAPATIFGYDITDIENQRKVNMNLVGPNLDIYVGNTNVQTNLWLASATKSPKRVSVITFPIIDRSQYGFLIVTDSRTRAGADEYKAYRESVQGGSYKVLVSETQSLFDQFNYGERSPIAIRRFAEFMTDTPKKMKYLFLIGKSISQTNLLRTMETDDYVPTFGFPASDILFSSGLLGKTETESSIPTGRLVVSTNSEITAYLNKVKEHESRPSSAWQKNLLHVTGPKSQSEYITLYNTLEGLRQIAITSSFGASAANYTTLNMPFNGAISSYPERPVPADYYTKINAGVGIMAYYGHGTSTSTAYNIGYVSTQIPTGVGGALYNNPGKYPVLLAFGCGISDSFFGAKDIASDWVNTPNKGAINALSMSYLSYEGYDTRNLESLYGTWFGTLPNAKKSANSKVIGTAAMLNSGIGDVAQQSSVNMVANYPGGDPNAPNPDLFFVANLQQTMLLGDPSIPVFKDPNIVQPLSLTLLDVKAINEEKKNVITWKTETEIDFNGFEIERSLDSKKFEKIGFVKGNNNFNEQNSYNFDDENPIEGLNYYRLKMIDNDGKSSYSKIVSTKFETLGNTPLIIGNPISGGKFSFQFNSYLENSALLNDIKGNKINMDVNALGNNLYNVNIRKSLQKGVYILKLSNKKGEIYSRKIISE